MKFKNLLPVTLLAVFALAACGPTDTSSAGGSTDASSADDSSSNPSSEEEVPNLGDFVDGLAVGEVAEPLAAIEEIAGLLPAADGLVNRAVQEFRDYWSTGMSDPANDDFAYEDYAVYDVKRYDNDVLSVELDYQRMAPEYDPLTQSYGAWPAEFSPYYTAEAYLFEDASNLNYVYEEDGDPDNPYSFAVSTAKDSELLEGYLNTIGSSSDILYGLALADEAYSYYLPSFAADGFNYVATSASVEKVAADGEVPAHAVVSYNTHLGYYLSAELAWGSSYAGIFVERYYNWGVDFIIADGFVQYAYLDVGSMMQAEYVDSSAAPVTPVVAESPWLTNEEWATYVTDVATVALDVVGYGSYYTFYETEYSDVSNGEFAAANLPVIANYREGDLSDAGLWINIDPFLA
ncbi:MAG: hypothetical protein WCR77_00305 [Bacilli bacterium]